MSRAAALSRFRRIARLAYQVDCAQRGDLHHKIVKNERDYVSNLTGGLRLALRANGLRAYAHSAVLSQQAEQLFGCDALIVIRRGRKAKLCLFESKWPLRTPATSWDQPQGQGLHSHFTDQLQRQKRWTHLAAVWEHFIVDHPQPSRPAARFDRRGSSCLWHQDVNTFDRKKRRYPLKPWDDTDLQRLALTTQTVMSFGKAILSACQCQRGQWLPIQGDHLTLPDNRRDEVPPIPASLLVAESQFPGFCQEAGVSNALLISMDEG